MEVKILNEAGYEEAKYGFSLSFKDRNIPMKDWWCSEMLDIDCSDSGFCCPDDCKREKRVHHYNNVLQKSSSRDGGHNKFLEHIMVWVDIEASLEFWKQFDTYRVGVSKQSESSMHTLDKRNITVEDFDLTEDELKIECIAGPTDIGDKNPTLDHILGLYLNYISMMSPRLKSKLLPQGYKQRREVVLSYKVLRHIISQRNGHKLPEWKMFINEIYSQVQYPELLPVITND